MAMNMGSTGTGVNLSAKRIEEYNDRVINARKRVDELSIELKVAEGRIEHLSADILRKYGLKVTAENAKEVYNKLMRAALETLEKGENILNKIDRGECVDEQGDTIIDTFEIENENDELEEKGENILNKIDRGGIKEETDHEEVLHNSFDDEGIDAEVEMLFSAGKVI